MPHWRRLNTDMEQELTLVRIGSSVRLERLLPQALAGLRVKELPPERIASAAGRRLLFAAAVRKR